MAARAGFEPATKWLTATCSATELPSNNIYIMNNPEPAVNRAERGKSQLDQKLNSNPSVAILGAPALKPSGISLEA